MATEDEKALRDFIIRHTGESAARAKMLSHVDALVATGERAVFLEALLRGVRAVADDKGYRPIVGLIDAELPPSAAPAAPTRGQVLARCYGERTGIALRDGAATVEAMQEAAKSLRCSQSECEKCAPAASTEDTNG